MIYLFPGNKVQLNWIGFEKAKWLWSYSPDPDGTARVCVWGRECMWTKETSNPKEGYLVDWEYVCFFWRVPWFDCFELSSWFIFSLLNRFYWARVMDESTIRFTLVSAIRSPLPERLQKWISIYKYNLERKASQLSNNNNNNTFTEEQKQKQQQQDNEELKKLLYELYPSEGRRKKDTLLNIALHHNNLNSVTRQFYLIGWSSWK